MKAPSDFTHPTVISAVRGGRYGRWLRFTYTWSGCHTLDSKQHRVGWVADYGDGLVMSGFSQIAAIHLERIQNMSTELGYQIFQFIAKTCVTNALSAQLVVLYWQVVCICWNHQWLTSRIRSPVLRDPLLPAGLSGNTCLM